MASPRIIADNDNLLREILIRLPVESLLRFKLVSKHWLSLITDQRFCLNKSQILCKNIAGLFLYRSSFYPDQVYDFIRLDDDNNSPLTTPPFRTLSFLPDHHQSRPKILRSCNGLLLCRTGFQLSQKGVMECNYYIFNPTTSKFATINPLDSQYLPVNCGDPSTVYLAFDPKKSANYKAIWIYVYTPPVIVHGAAVVHGFKIGIYHSSLGVWKWCSYSDEVNSYPFTPTPQINLETGVYWNGAINWTSNLGSSSLYFNVDEERLGTFPMPEVPEFWEEEGRRIRYFGESNDHLHLIATTCPRATRFNVYEMMNRVIK